MSTSNKGFSLIEIMVALVIGMISMVVIMQVFLVSEGRKRTTLGGADAQANGAIAFHMIERDIKMAGWGIESSMFEKCPNMFAYCDGSEACKGAGLNMSFAAVIVADGANGGPDTVTARYFADPNAHAYRFPSRTTLRSDMPSPSAELNVHSTGTCADGDLMLVEQNANCTLMQNTSVQTTALKIQHNPGQSGKYNPPANIQANENWPAYRAGASLTCFKPAPTGPFFSRAYSVDTVNRQLNRNDNSLPAGSNGAIAPEIFDMQVQYGVALTAGSKAVTNWVDATGTWKEPSKDDWKKIKAVRIALVARSAQYERPEQGQPCATTASTANWSTWAQFNAANYPADWKCYRYKTFETVVPLRNVIWSNL